ncbi:MAG: F0F1 ATP synthase subunit gamma [bacterium]
MSDTITGLRRQIKIAEELRSVVRTMKALAALSIGQYERAGKSQDIYYRTILLGLKAVLGDFGLIDEPEQNDTKRDRENIGIIVFGSDQGLVGRFNEVIAEHVVEKLQLLGGRPFIWTVGERVRNNLSDAGFTSIGDFPVPFSIQEVTSLVGEIYFEVENHRLKHGYEQVFIFYNQPKKNVIYEPIWRKLLPLDSEWQKEIDALTWPTRVKPEIITDGTSTLRALIREYLFISLFRACALSLAAENESRLAAMERADKNIGELLESLRRGYNQVRQALIDAELFDVISGYEALAKKLQA